MKLKEEKCDRKKKMKRRGSGKGMTMVGFFHSNGYRLHNGCLLCLFLENRIWRQFVNQLVGVWGKGGELGGSIWKLVCISVFADFTFCSFA